MVYGRVPDEARLESAPSDLSVRSSGPEHLGYGQVVPTTPEDRFAAIAKEHLGEPGVAGGTGFGGNPGLRVDGKIFAMLVRDELVVKLPRDRVADLVEAGIGAPFEPGTGRAMKEWISVPARASRRWRSLVNEARTFVGSS